MHTFKQSKYILCSWIGRINIVKCLYYSKQYTDSMQLISIFKCQFSQIQNRILKFARNKKKRERERQTKQITDSVLKKENKAGGIILSDFKLYYKAIAIKRAHDWHKNRHTAQWNRREHIETNPHINDQLIYNKGAKNIQQGKDSLFS